MAISSATPQRLSQNQKACSVNSGQAFFMVNVRVRKTRFKKV